MQLQKGLSLSPGGFGFADQFGMVNSSNAYQVDASDIERMLAGGAVDGAIQEGQNQTQTAKKGQWWKENGAEVIGALPDLYCLLFPNNCQGKNRNLPSYPNYPPPPPEPKRDWLTIVLIVLVLVVLVFIILKK